MDIDSDIYSTGRGKVIEYVRNKYGYNAVCGIMTMTMQAPKGSINIAAKYYGFKKCGTPMTALGRRIAKDVPDDPGTSFASIVGKNDGKISNNGKGITLLAYLNEKYKDDKKAADALEIIRWAQIMEGSFTSYSAHAAGIVISDGGDVSEYLPLRMNTELGMMTTQCDKEQVEENGLLKFDFLGLKTLDIITQTIRTIEENTGSIIDPLSVDLSDSEVYENIFSAGKTNSVFQFESSGMKSMLKRFKPESFEDLIILVSMFRPGPLQYLDDVIAVKNGTKPMEFLCQELKPILGKTYGAIVYQEQVMQICQSLAGFTLGHADQVRRFMSKKKADKLAHEREAFVKGCQQNGIGESISNKLFDQMMDFASYAFNKSHAAAYAYNAFLTGWFKYYYPVEFFTAALNWATPDKLPGLMYEAKAFGVEVQRPDINASGMMFETQHGTIRFGLSSVAGVKSNADIILKERTESGTFRDLKDFSTRVIGINHRALENLIHSGAFDSFSKNRAAMVMLAEKLKQPIGKLESKKSFVASAEFALPKIESFTTNEELIAYQKDNGYKAELKELTTVSKLNTRITNAANAIRNATKEIELIREPKIPEDKTERMNLEKEFLGLYLTDHPMDYYPNTGCQAIDETDEISTMICGVITNLETKKRKSDGADMAFFDLEDRSGSIPVMCFANEYSVYGGKLKNGQVVKIKGKVTEDSFGDDVILKFILKELGPMSKKKSTYFLSVSSYASFHLDAEEEFIKNYACQDGHNVIIFDKALDEMREFNHKVSDKVKDFPNVKEIWV